MKFHLQTDRLILRQFKESDLETFIAYRNDPEVARYQGWEHPYPREKAVVFVQDMITAVPSPSNWLQTAIELKATGEMIGDLAFFIRGDDSRQSTIGYSLAHQYWGQGYAFEAVLRLLAYLFEDLHLHRVGAECDVDNPASWRLLEKLGFRREAHLIENVFYNGAYVSEYHYALLWREWRERHSSTRDETQAAQG